MPASNIQHWCGRKPSDTKPIFYHGINESAVPPLIKAGVSTFCVSHFYPRNVNVFLENKKKHPKIRSFLDSGAFTFLVNGSKHGTSAKEMDRQAELHMADYAQWVKKHGKAFDFYITFDYRAEAPLTRRTTEQLRKLGIAPTPVFHGDSSFDYLRRYIDEGYKLIGISRRYFRKDRTKLPMYYEQIFNITEKAGVACHGFAATGNFAWQYPWYSVDSTNLLMRSQGWGIIYYYNPHRIRLELITVGNIRTGNSNSKDVLRFVEANGGDLKVLQNSYLERTAFNGKVFEQFLKVKTEANKGATCQRKTLF